MFVCWGAHRVVIKSQGSAGSTPTLGINKYETSVPFRALLGGVGVMATQNPFVRSSSLCGPTICNQASALFQCWFFLLGQC
jgi:hypothetical protein